MNITIPYLFFIVIFIVSLYVIGDKSFFDNVHTSRQKTVVTMSLIISSIVLIMTLTIYFLDECQNEEMD